MKISDYDVVSREFNCFFDVQMKRNIIKKLDSYLENVFRIYDHEVTSEKKQFNVYVYDGDFLRPFKRELLKKSEDIMPSIYSLCSSSMVANNIDGEQFKKLVPT